MTIRQRYLWDSDLQEWRPDHEVYAKRGKQQEASFNFHVYKSGYNHSLGGYCGSKTDEKILMNRIEDRTGDRVEPIGDAKLKNTGTKRDYSVKEAMERRNG